METQTPNDGQIDLWVTRPDEVTDPALLDHYRALMTKEEAARAARFVFERDRHQFLVTRALVRTVLSRYADVDPRDWRFGENHFGKPHVTGPEELPVMFNVSHTAGLVVCAVAKSDAVGVDVERTDRDAEHLNIAKRFFAEPEWRMLEAVAPNERAKTFFRIWTLKEAYIKAHGSGLSIPLGSFSVMPNAEAPPKLELLDPSLPLVGAWQFRQFELDGQFLVAVCVNRPEDAALDVRVYDYVPSSGET